ncbi:hypothetical protein EDC01DRAFT_679817 [Geopyxis carbonaria]|nr:hypothetical protein EDC01DRAFT_679817 [Geopyxis carbonaria]
MLSEYCNVGISLVSFEMVPRSFHNHHHGIQIVGRPNVPKQPHKQSLGVECDLSRRASGSSLFDIESISRVLLSITSCEGPELDKLFTMAAILQPYSTHIFNTIPSLHDSATAFQTLDGQALVTSVFKPLIEKHSLEGVLGVGLLHRHFDLSGPEKLVEFNNVATPWKHYHDGDQHTGGRIVPNGWMFTGDGKLMPFEFFFSPLGREAPVDLEQLQSFVEEFRQLVDANRLHGLVCLRLFPHAGYSGGLEITEGRTNINLTPGQIAAEDLENSTETMWFFDKEYNIKKYTCRCKPYSWHMHLHGHNKPDPM